VLKKAARKRSNRASHVSNKATPNLPNPTYPTGRRQAAGGSPGGAVTLEGGNDDGWSERMRDRYGLDTSQFSYRPPSRAGGGAGGDGTNAATSATPRGCVVM
jgi:hypothetical protein